MKYDISAFAELNDSNHKKILTIPSKAPRISGQPFIVGNNQCCDNSNLQNLLQQLLKQCQNTTIITASCVCSPIAITQPITITQPGFYCLANDITGSIAIETDNVIINLNNHTITGDVNAPLLISAGTHRIIYNGVLTGSPNAGVEIDSNSIDTQLSALSITDCPIAILADSVTDCFIHNNIFEACGQGVAFTGTNINIFIKDFTISNMASTGIDTSLAACDTIFLENGSFRSISDAAIFLGDVVNLHLNSITIESASGGIVGIGTADTCICTNVTVDNSGPFGISFSTLINGIIQNCHVFNGETASESLGFSVGLGESVQFINCSANHLISGIEGPPTSAAPLSSTAFLVTGGDTIEFTGCVANRIVSGNDEAFGFLMDSVTNVSFRNCTVQFVEGQGSGDFASAGYSLISTTTVRFDNCQVLDALFETSGFIIDANSASVIMDNCSANNCAFQGFLIAGIENSLTQCQAIETSTGFLITGTHNIFNYCQSNFNSDTGFSSFDATNFFGNCSAINNSNNGFVDGSLYHCFASQNGTDYNGITGPTDNVNATTFSAGANLFF